MCQYRGVLQAWQVSPTGHLAVRGCGGEGGGGQVILNALCSQSVLLCDEVNCILNATKVVCCAL